MLLPFALTFYKCPLFFRHHQLNSCSCSCASACLHLQLEWNFGFFLYWYKKCPGDHRNNDYGVWFCNMMWERATRKIQKKSQEEEEDWNFFAVVKNIIVIRFVVLCDIVGGGRRVSHTEKVMRVVKRREIWWDIIVCVCTDDGDKEWAKH